MIWFKRLIFSASFLTLCVVVFGAFVRLTDSGLGCPDWPGCFGTLTVPESATAINEAQNSYPGTIVDITKAWYEMIHRYLAGILGLLILTIAIFSYKIRDQLRVRLILPFSILVLVIFQAALGMWTVTELLKPAIVTLHLMGGMTILGLLTYMTHRHIGTVSNTIILDDFICANEQGIACDDGNGGTIASLKPNDKINAPTTPNDAASVAVAIPV